MITLLLLARATYIWVLFFVHIPFMVNRTFNATPTERDDVITYKHSVGRGVSSTLVKNF